MVHYPCRPSFVDDVTIDPFELNHNSLVSFTYCTTICKHSNIFNVPSLYLVSFVDIKINVDLFIIIYLPLFINNLLSIGKYFTLRLFYISSLMLITSISWYFSHNKCPTFTVFLDTLNYKYMKIVRYSTPNCTKLQVARVVMFHGCKVNSLTFLSSSWSYVGLILY